MADAPQNEAPEGLETKDVKMTNRLEEMRSSPVPHVNRTGSQLTDEERAAADAPNQGSGITTSSAGASTEPTLGSSETATKKPAQRPKA